MQLGLESADKAENLTLSLKNLCSAVSLALPHPQMSPVARERLRVATTVAQAWRSPRIATEPSQLAYNSVILAVRAVIEYCSNLGTESYEESRLVCWIERFERDLRWLDDAWPEAAPEPIRPAETQYSNRNREILDKLAENYSRDAHYQKLLAVLLASLSGAATTVAFGMALYVIPWRLSTTTSDWVRISFFCALAILMAAAGYSARKATLAERNSRELQRLGRGLQGFDSFLDPLPVAVQTLLRSAYLQSLFPRLLDDDDPLRQISWPENKLILDSVYRGWEFGGGGPHVNSGETAGP